MSDKQIRFNVEGADKVTRAYEEIRRKQDEIANSGRRANKEEQAELDKRLKSLKELQRQQEINYREEINRSQINVQSSQLGLRGFLAQRERIGEGLSGDKRKRFDEQTGEISGKWEQNIQQEKLRILRLRRELAGTQTEGKDQVTEIRNVSETIRNEGVRTRRDSNEVLSRMTSGAGSLMSGNLGTMLAGLLRFAGPAAAAGMLVSSAINITKERQNALTGFAATADISNIEAVYRSGNLRNARLGLDPVATSMKASLYSRALGSDLTREGSEKDIFNIAGLQIGRGFSDQQIQQLLSIQRYSGMSVFGQTNVLEEYTRRRDGNIIKLPEILDHYLRIANEILNRTGNLNPSSLQQVLTSVGSSYNVSGLQLERMSSGIIGLGKDQGAGIMRAFRMETLRKLYPGMSTWDMFGKMEDPTKDPKYLEEIVGRAKKFGGGGDWTKFFLMSQGFSWNEVEKLMKGDFKLSDMSYGKSDDKMLQDKYLKEGESKIGNIEKFEKSLGELSDAVSKLTTAILDGDLKAILMAMSSPLGAAISVAISDHLKRRNP